MRASCPNRDCHRGKVIVHLPAGGTMTRDCATCLGFGVLARENPRGRRSSSGRRRSSSARRNPPGKLMSEHVLLLRYHHIDSAQRIPYEHRFTPGVQMYACPDGSVLLRKPGVNLHGVFTVRDDE